MGANIRSMVRLVRSNNSLPVLATLTPSNTGFNNEAPPSRNVWVAAANEMIRGIARDERVLLADIGAEFAKQTDLSRLFSDHVHPNDAGYQIIADVYFKAITRGSVAGSSSFGSPVPLFFTRATRSFAAPDALR
jgi:lysophospholipase L1-like esterase